MNPIEIRAKIRQWLCLLQKKSEEKNCKNVRKNHNAVLSRTQALFLSSKINVFEKSEKGKKQLGEKNAVGQ